VGKLNEAGHPLPTYQINHLAFFSQGFLIFITYEPVPEAHDIFKRFAKVFEQTYTRFLDLQKAEAQARESQIEAALERVRSRTMAMQKTDELCEAGALLYKELSDQGIPSVTSGYALMDDEGKIDWQYMVSPEDGSIFPEPLGVPRDGNWVLSALTKSWKKQEPFHIVELNPQETIVHQTHIAETTINFHYTAAELISFSPERLVIHTFNFKHGYILMVGGVKLTAAQIEIMVRFTKVFEQTYTRFLDLQKAEAQAREAQIEAALERVRSRSMGMQKSDELREVLQLIFNQMSQLGIKIDTASFNLDYKASDDLSSYFATPGQGYPIKFFIPILDNPIFKDLVKAKNDGIEFFAHSYTLEVKNSFFEHFFIHAPIIPESRRNFLLSSPGYGCSVVLMDSIMLTIINYDGELYSEYENSILKRFAKVFEQTYTRFLDLQKAEAQAREAQIEAALERVRSRTMAMQNSDELAELVATVFTELNRLEFALTSCIIWINNPELLTAEMWVASTEMNKPPEPYYIKPFRHPYFKSVIDAWK